MEIMIVECVAFHACAPDATFYSIPFQLVFLFLYLEDEQSTRTVGGGQRVPLHTWVNDDVDVMRAECECAVTVRPYKPVM